MSVKSDKRRRNLLDEFWLKQSGNRSSPKFAARNIRKHLSNPKAK